MWVTALPFVVVVVSIAMIFAETGIRSRLGLDFREVKVQNEKDESF